MDIDDVMYPDILVEVKFYIVNYHLPDDPDMFAGTLPKGVIVCTAFSYLGIVIGLEGSVVFNNVSLRFMHVVLTHSRSLDGG